MTSLGNLLNYMEKVARTGGAAEIARNIHVDVAPIKTVKAPESLPPAEPLPSDAAPTGTADENRLATRLPDLAKPSLEGLKRPSVSPPADMQSREAADGRETGRTSQPAARTSGGQAQGQVRTATVPHAQAGDAALRAAATASAAEVLDRLGGEIAGSGRQDASRANESASSRSATAKDDSRSGTTTAARGSAQGATTAAPPSQAAKPPPTITLTDTASLDDRRETGGSTTGARTDETSRTSTRAAAPGAEAGRAAASAAETTAAPEASSAASASTNTTSYSAASAASSASTSTSSGADDDASRTDGDTPRPATATNATARPAAALTGMARHPVVATTSVGETGDEASSTAAEPRPDPGLPRSVPASLIATIANTAVNEAAEAIDTELYAEDSEDQRFVDRQTESRQATARSVAAARANAPVAAHTAATATDDRRTGTETTGPSGRADRRAEVRTDTADRAATPAAPAPSPEAVAPRTLSAVLSEADLALRNALAMPPGEGAMEALGAVILNAAMIPGYPSPRPLTGNVPEGQRALPEQTGAEAHLDETAEAKLEAYLGVLGLPENVMTQIRAILADDQRRRGFLLTLARLMKALQTILSTLKSELESMAEDLDEELLGAGTGKRGAPRHRLPI